MSIKRKIKKGWKTVKRFFASLWLACFGWLYKKEEEPIAETFNNDEHITDSDGATPRGGARVDDLLGSLPSNLREQLQREYELKNRKPPLVKVQRTSSAPAEMQTAPNEDNKSEMPVLEEIPERKENS